jgi:hypothetical protein
MQLTAEQQAVFDALVAKQAETEPRTETGLVGILHSLIDSASGAVAHRGEDVWAALHHQAEQLAETAVETAVTGEAPAEVPAEAAADDSSSGSPGKGKAGKS